MKRVLSGVQPTGSLTLGNYLGAIRNWIPFQGSHDCFFMVANLHALTGTPDPSTLKEHCRLTAAAYIASGIDPTKSSLFIQSHVPEHSELSWLLNCITPLGWLNRMTQFKDKVGKNRDLSNLGLYAYPVLMAADILLYNATHVPVGDDQKQHLELTRDIAVAFNQRFGETFVLPEPMILGTATRVMSLRDGTTKMSKSDPSDMSRINLLDDNDLITKKIKKAKSDPDVLPGSLDGLENRPEAKNLMNLLSVLTNSTLDVVCSEYEGKNFSDLKTALSEATIHVLSPIRSEIQRFMKDPGYLDDLLKIGAEKAKSIATPILNTVKKHIGLL